VVRIEAKRYADRGLFGKVADKRDLGRLGVDGKMILKRT
jgi:hypothetical protein